MDPPIPATEVKNVPASPGATYDRWGVPRVEIATDERTGVTRVNMTAVLGDAPNYSPDPADRVTLAVPDLIAEFAADQDALIAIQSVTAGILLLARKLMDRRGVR